jgi:chromosome segregation ATPase
LKVKFRRRPGGKAGNDALGEFGTLLRLVFGSAAATVAAYLDRLDPTLRAKANRSEDAGATVKRVRRQLAAAKAQREALVSEILRYDKAREVLTAQISAEPDLERQAALRLSLQSLEERLTLWLDEHDELGATIRRLEADLAFFDAAFSPEEQEQEQEQEQKRDNPQSDPSADDSAPTPDARTREALAALGLTTMPATLADLKTAYRDRLKAVHPDINGHGSTEAAARATVAFAELRKRFP